MADSRAMKAHMDARVTLLVMGLSAMAMTAGAAEDADIIVVTAERAARPLAESPVAVTPVDLMDEAARLAEHPASLINRVPGAFIQAGSGQEHLTAIRSPVLTGGAGAGSFLYLQDGVPLRSAGFANVNGLFDAMTPFADRLEVVRGPGDVTYGANAVHGAVNVISPSPLGEDFRRLRLGTGAFERYSGTAEWRGGNFYTALHGYSDGGYRDDSGVNQLKGQLAHGWQGEGVSITSRASFHHLEQETAGFVQGEDAYRDDALRRSNPNPAAFRDLDHLVLSSEAVLTRTQGVLTLTPYAIVSDMTFRLHFLPSQAIEVNSHVATGLLSSWRQNLGARTELLAGFDLEWAKGDLFEEQAIPDVFSYTQGVHYDYEVTSLSAAPFLRIRHQATERLSLQAGARLNHTRYEYDNRIASGTVGRFLRPADREDDFTVLTGRVGGIYDLGSGVSLIASFSRGARPPQTTDLYRLQINQSVDGIEPETLDMAEAGIRYFADSLTAEIIGFRGRKAHFLFRDADGFTVDDGKTDHAGVEFLLDWQVNDALGLRLAGTVADHRYGFSRRVAQSSEVIRAGTEVDTAPGTLLNAALRWRPADALRLSARLAHVGAYKMDAAGTVRYSGHEVVDLDAEWQLTDRLVLSGEISNLFDTRYATRADFAFGSERYFPGEERAARAALTISW
ncbi:TonB-dependent receptor [Parvularcula marina]|uniref:TonB-dependent receptor n=1 Tax=Parvularcula marina TaxID=2292771 RepID=A0A371RI64_9PROT|nr:TonB-dependent receptor [Parvularcula marina]RFB05122.1 TonB-dependent receptor [Parvularcula marina]